jgi:hypothetical protein
MAVLRLVDDFEASIEVLDANNGAENRCRSQHHTYRCEEKHHVLSSGDSPAENDDAGD